MNLPKKHALIVFLCFLSLLGLAADAHAVFDLTVTPRRGGQGIRFESGKPGRLLRNEEVTLTVTSTLAAQYRVFQNVYQPLTNEFGDVIPQNSFIVFSPSTPLGTLRTQLETPILMGQMPIYTSNAAGGSDEFVLVFNVRVPENQPGGIYHTQMTFTAEPVNAQSGVSPRVVTLDVRVEITPSFRVTLESSGGSRSLDLGKVTDKKPVVSGSIKVSLDSNIGTPYKLIQQVSEPLISTDGALLDDDFILLTAAGGSRGSLAVGAAPVKILSSPALIYTSDSAGGSDVLQLQYQTAENKNPKAGVYSGMLSFKLESTSPLVPSQIFNVPIRIEIETVFYLDVQMEGGSAVNFGIFRTGEEKQERKVTLTAHTNLGQPYQVSQMMTRKLTNREGVAIPKEYFQFFGSDAKTGALAVMSPAPVEEGQRVVFTSDRQGTPEKFSLNYILKVPVDARSGAYNCETIYTITTT